MTEQPIPSGRKALDERGSSGYVIAMLPELSLRRAATLLWAGPNSVVGLLLVPLALLPGGSVRLRDGVLECVVGSLPSFARRVGARTGIEVLTLGHVVVAGSARLMSISRRHERVHVRQYERYGPLFLPLYVASSILALVRGRHPYSHNRFEREAEAGKKRAKKG